MSPAIINGLLDDAANLEVRARRLHEKLAPLEENGFALSVEADRVPVGGGCGNKIGKGMFCVMIDGFLYFGALCCFAKAHVDTSTCSGGAGRFADFFKSLAEMGVEVIPCFVGNSFLFPIATIIAIKPQR